MFLDLKYKGQKAPDAAAGERSSAGSAARGRSEAEKMTIADFQLLKVLGKGSFGKVFLVRLIASQKIFALKVTNALPKSVSPKRQTSRKQNNQTQSSIDS
jgi:serine/threonine protein kinase